MNNTKRIENEINKNKFIYEYYKTLFIQWDWFLASLFLSLFILIANIKEFMCSLRLMHFFFIIILWAFLLLFCLMNALKYRDKMRKIKHNIINDYNNIQII